MPTYYKHHWIEKLELPAQNGFDLFAYAVSDEDARPEDFDCYTETQQNAWKNDEWFFVGVYVVASKNGIELAESSLWGIEYGQFPLTDELDNVESISSIYLPSLAESILPDLITETIDLATDNLDELKKAS